MSYHAPGLHNSSNALRSTMICNIKFREILANNSNCAPHNSPQVKTSFIRILNYDNGELDIQIFHPASILSPASRCLVCLYKVPKQM